MQLRRQVCARATARYLIAVIQANVGPRTSEGFDQAAIGGNDIALRNQDDVARHKLFD